MVRLQVPQPPNGLSFFAWGEAPHGFCGVPPDLCPSFFFSIGFCGFLECPLICSYFPDPPIPCPSPSQAEWSSKDSLAKSLMRQKGVDAIESGQLGVCSRVVFCLFRHPLLGVGGGWWCFQGKPKGSCCVCLEGGDVCKGHQTEVTHLGGRRVFGTLACPAAPEGRWKLGVWLPASVIPISGIPPCLSLLFQKRGFPLHLGGSRQRSLLRG